MGNFVGWWKFRVDGGGGGSCFRQFVSYLVAWYNLMTQNPDEDSEAFPVAQSMANRLGVMDATLDSVE